MKYFLSLVHKLFTVWNALVLFVLMPINIYWLVTDPFWGLNRWEGFLLAIVYFVLDVWLIYCFYQEVIVKRRSNAKTQ